jgi:hypothetical protein
MTNNYLLSLIALAALAWAVVDPPATEPQPRSVASHAATSDPASAPHATADLNLLEARRPPIPLMRNVQPPAKVVIPPEVAMADADVKTPDNSGVGTAKAAIEADGYKRVSVIGRQGNGTWRAKAYRGQTEVQLTVDETGRVSLE